ncbi:MAG TPA: hypothetical protein VNF93_02400 [Buchnera sp. (in: enterobacteria)]|nr:hypothetical protein [Buchnera sp. (in: enterobacteria)]
MKSRKKAPKSIVVSKKKKSDGYVLVDDKKTMGKGMKKSNCSGMRVSTGYRKS